MLEIYSGIKIEDKIVIVEKQNTEHQGYLVNYKDKKQLESALSWAKITFTPKDTQGNPIVDYYYYYDENHKVVHTDKYDKSYYIKYKYETLEGIVHEYNNGEFSLAVSESANCSSQGGKLSFWNCTIIAPDGKEFLIGINSDCLLSLLQNNTFVNGKCQNKVWLGRIKSNVGAFTENMDEFIQGKKDRAVREAKKTSNYDIGSILIPSYKVYCGKFYHNFELLYRSNGYSYRNNLNSDYLVNIYATPKPVYMYKQLFVPHNINRQLNGKQPSLSDYAKSLEGAGIYKYDFQKTKSAAVISAEQIKIDTEQMRQNTRAEVDRMISEAKNPDSDQGKAFCTDLLKKYQNCACAAHIKNPPKYEVDELEYTTSENNKTVEQLLEFFAQYSIPCKIDMTEDEMEDWGDYRI